MTTPTLTRSEALAIVRDLDPEITSIIGLDVSFDADADVCGGGCWTWSCRVRLGFDSDSDLVDVTIPDHWPEGAEVHW